MTLKIKEKFFFDKTIFKTYLYITRKFELHGSFGDKESECGFFPDPDPGGPKRPKKIRNTGFYCTSKINPDNGSIFYCII